MASAANLSLRIMSEITGVSGAGAVQASDLLESARKLGQMVAKHPSIQKYVQATSAFEKDTDSQRLLADYSRFIESLAQKEATGRPIEVADKRKLETLQTQLAMHPILRGLQMAEVEFADTLRKVDQAIIQGAGLDMRAGKSAGG